MRLQDHERRADERLRQIKTQLKADWASGVTLKGRLDDLDFLIGEVERAYDQREANRLRQEAMQESIDKCALRVAAMAAQLREIKQERDHERHEKETVADAAQAHARYMREQLDTQNARIRELRHFIEAAITHNPA